MIDVQVQPLHCVLAQAPARAMVLHGALASMSPEVLAYRGLQPVREALLEWLKSMGNIK
jgi:dimethylamine monooxygenase subunit A